VSTRCAPTSQCVPSQMTCITRSFSRVHKRPSGSKSWLTVDTYVVDVERQPASGDSQQPQRPLYTARHAPAALDVRTGNYLHRRITEDEPTRCLKRREIYRISAPEPSRQQLDILGASASRLR
jgi:hypothetical protein